MSTRVDIEKKRMEFAFDNSKDAPNPKKYESYVLKVPAFILTNGLGNTIAYIASQSDKNWQKVGNNIFDWLDDENSIYSGRLSDNLNNEKKIIKLLNTLKNENDETIKLCTNEVLALFNWLRRFAKINKN